MMDDILKQMLGGQIGEWTSKLEGMAGFDTDKAGSFLSGIIDKVAALFQSGSLDITSLMGEVDVDGLVDQLDPKALAEQAGISPEQAKSALQQILPDLVGQAKSALDGLGGMFQSLD